jgi:hypothetical protein
MLPPPEIGAGLIGENPAKGLERPRADPQSGPCWMKSGRFSCKE